MLSLPQTLPGQHSKGGGGPDPAQGGWGTAPGRIVLVPALERPKPGDACEVPAPGQQPCISPVPSAAGHAQLARLGSHPDRPHCLWLPAQRLCLINEKVWIFLTI